MLLIVVAHGGAIARAEAPPLAGGEPLRLSGVAGRNSELVVRALGLQLFDTLADKPAPSGKKLLRLELALENRRLAGRNAPAPLKLQRKDFTLVHDGALVEATADFTPARAFAEKIEVPGKAPRRVRGVLAFVVPASEPVTLTLRVASTAGTIELPLRWNATDRFVLSLVAPDGRQLSAGATVTLRGAGGAEVTARPAEGGALLSVTAAAGAAKVRAAAAGHRPVDVDATFRPEQRSYVIVLAPEASSEEDLLGLSSLTQGARDGATGADVGHFADSLGTPEDARAAVRDRIALVAGDGLVRGASAALRAGAGSSADRAALLAEVLGQMGETTRYACATLSEEEAAALYASAAAVPQPGLWTDAGRQLLDEIRGAAADDAAAALAVLGKAGVTELGAGARALPRDYCWVQRRDGASWVDMDPRVGAQGGAAPRPMERTPSLGALDWGVTLRLVGERGAQTRSYLEYRTTAAALGQDLLGLHFHSPPAGGVATGADSAGDLLGGLGGARRPARKADGLLVRLVVAGELSGYVLKGKALDLAECDRVWLELATKPPHDPERIVRRLIYDGAIDAKQGLRYDAVFLSAAPSTLTLQELARRLDATLRADRIGLPELRFGSAWQLYGWLRAHAAKPTAAASAEPELVMAMVSPSTGERAGSVSLDLTAPARRAAGAATGAGALQATVEGGLIDVATEGALGRLLRGESGVSEEQRFYAAERAAKIEVVAVRAPGDLERLSALPPEARLRIEALLARGSVVLAPTRLLRDDARPRLWSLEPASGRFVDVDWRGFSGTAESGSLEQQAVATKPAVNKASQCILKWLFVAALNLGAEAFITGGGEAVPYKPTLDPKNRTYTSSCK